MPIWKRMQHTSEQTTMQYTQGNEWKKINSLLIGTVRAHSSIVSTMPGTCLSATKIKLKWISQKKRSELRSQLHNAFSVQPASQPNQSNPPLFLCINKCVYFAISFWWNKSMRASDEIGESHFIAYLLMTTGIVNIANWFVDSACVLHKI